MKFVRNWSLEGMWHWLRYKPIRRQKIRHYVFKGELIDVALINDWEYVFESRSWYSLLFGGGCGNQTRVSTSTG
jgi:hypothetical protein